MHVQPNVPAADRPRLARPGAAGDAAVGARRFGLAGRSKPYRRAVLVQRSAALAERHRRGDRVDDAIGSAALLAGGAIRLGAEDSATYEPKSGPTSPALIVWLRGLFGTTLTPVRGALSSVAAKTSFLAATPLQLFVSNGLSPFSTDPSGPLVAIIFCSKSLKTLICSGVAV